MDMGRLNVLTAAMSTDDTPTTKSVKGVIYAASGEGKSHLAMELADRITPEGKAWLMIDTSDNWTISDQINEGRGPQKPWAHLPFTFIEDIRLVAEAIANGVEPYDSIGTVILDEGSKMAQLDVDRIFDQKGSAALADTPGWGEYRPGLIRFRGLIHDLSAIPGLNVLIVAHERAPGPADKAMTKTQADFPKATLKEVKGAMTFVARISAEELTKAGQEEATYSRMIQIHPTKAFDAKSRLGVSLVKFPTEWFSDAVVKWLNSGKPESTEDDTVEEIDDTIKPQPMTEEQAETPTEESLLDTLNEEITDFTFTPSE